MAAKTVDDFAKEGHSAFPYQGGSYTSAGMTLRDYFAAKAMQGMSANPYYDDFDWDKVAEMAFAQAEAMLAERAK